MPLRRITGLLSNWAPGKSLGDAAVSGEESRLLDAFARVQGRFVQTLARERKSSPISRHGRTARGIAQRWKCWRSLSPPAQGQSERIQRAISMVDAIASALESARAISLGQGIETQQVNLAGSVDDAWSSLGAYPETRGLRFANQVPSQTLVHADRHALLTILRNLMRNAAEHAAPALCTVRMSEHSIEVADDGPGIAAEDLAFVFDRYYRGRLSDSPDNGTVSDRGLGLAIARQVADLCGWKLTVASERGRGTNFILTLS
jgi:signal transduction histidine kinase